MQRHDLEARRYVETSTSVIWMGKLIIVLVFICLNESVRANPANRTPKRRQISLIRYNHRGIKCRDLTNRPQLPRCRCIATGNDFVEADSI